MATYLYRIGKFAYRRKGAVLSFWIAMLVLFGVGAATLSGPTTDSFTLPGTPAQQTQDLMAERFPTAEDPMNALSARFVFAAPDGQTLDDPHDPQNMAAVDEVLAAIRGIDTVSSPAKVDPATASPEQQAGALVRSRAGRCRADPADAGARPRSRAPPKKLPSPTHRRCRRSAPTTPSVSSPCRSTAR